MKTQEQALTEWVSDEIRFDGGTQKMTSFNRDQMTVVARGIREKKQALEFELGPNDPQTVKIEPNRVTASVGWAVDWREAEMLERMARGAGIEISPQWLIQFDGIKDARVHMMEGWIPPNLSDVGV